MAQPACVTQNMAVPPGANDQRQGGALLHRHDGPRLQHPAAHARSERTRTIRAQRSCPTARCRQPAPRATSSSARPMRPRPRPSPRTAFRKAPPSSFTMSSKESVDLQSRPDPRRHAAGCSNSSIMRTTTAPGDKSNMIVTTSHPGTWTRTDRRSTSRPSYVRGTRGAVHRGRRRRLDGLQGPDRHPRQPDPAAAACRRWSPSRSATAGRMPRAASAG